MLNNNINFDLHIHSNASSYKEEKGLVDKSTIENIEILFNKLNDNNINLFSFTDYNRFDELLYEKAIRIINDTQKYPNVKNILPGVEFDVRIDKEKNHVTSLLFSMIIIIKTIN